jgi:hypothetical protein
MQFTGGLLIKCIYVEIPELDSEARILFVKGEGTGYHSEYYFRMIDGKWFLSKEMNLGF